MDRVFIAGVGVADGDEIIKVSPSWSFDAPVLTVTLADRQRRMQYAPALAPGGTTPLGDIITAEHAGTRWLCTSITPGAQPVGTFEHWISATLRGKLGPVTAAANVNRPQFNKSLLSLQGRAKWRTVVTDASGRKPPVLDAKTVSQVREQEAARDAVRAPGFAKDASFKIGGQAASPAQKRVLATALSVADDEDAPPRAVLALVCALIVESRAQNLSYGDSTSKGPLQLLASTAQGLGVSANDVAAVCRLFLRDGYWKYRPDGAIALSRKHPAWSAGQIAQACQGSAFPDRYDQARGEARAVIAAWSGSATTEAEPGEERETFAVGADESYWDHTRTSAEAVYRRRFIAAGNVVYWEAESTLAKSRPYLTLTPFQTGCILMPGTLDERRNIDKLSASLLLPATACGDAIGRAVAVADYGSLSGTYVVEKAARSTRNDRMIQVDLVRARNPLRKAPGQSAGTASVAGTGSTSVTTTAGVPAKVGKVKAFIDRTTAKKQGYLWGGQGAGPYDCSGFASAVLQSVGLLGARLNTTGLVAWGKPGQGKWLTVWVRETGVDELSHCYVTVTIGGRVRVAEAGGIKGALTGWRGAGSPARRSGFVPRHAEGW